MTIAYTSDDLTIRAMQAALSVIDAAISDGDSSDDAAEAYDLLQAAIVKSDLIAAAPELLEALEAVVRVADRNTIEFDKARAAIAKARGE